MPEPTVENYKNFACVLILSMFEQNAVGHGDKENWVECVPIIIRAFGLKMNGTMVADALRSGKKVSGKWWMTSPVHDTSKKSDLREKAERLMESGCPRSKAAALLGVSYQTVYGWTRSQRK
jgi:hypothetical protein